MARAVREAAAGRCSEGGRRHCELAVGCRCVALRNGGDGLSLSHFANPAMYGPGVALAKPTGAGAAARHPRGSAECAPRG